ncbi:MULTISPECIES: TetR/AcrR family transcriptional regulator [unclassified Mucilaginibacter]|uniref:TetR/AcrR family transcriptional regulator n=1 Tax=unclassified Mucilaginibacter TaxID=2617802 RepID=UPI00095D4180|nr:MULTISPECIES: TetR/AcrR family transcriptional regulator [unclassified Mucilaginibacter]OJW12557.1 MAG: TetR family transcriptional regulator [Mucilaginibacter sp. 44-25]PLW90382.1 MAG: TetR/AcrR family transcriptional regulator [Mucilaginibacter sp.]HEK20915.1 TetR/AcrR family transcriptional regulator [Bacteroidota bacterium]
MEADKIKESIKRAAQDLFRKFGYHKTSVNEIAKRAKIAKATIYKYFNSKEEVLHVLLMDYIQVSVDELIANTNELDEESHLSNLIMKTCRLSYTVCNEFIGWDFIRESTNSQEFLKNLSNELEELLVHSFTQGVGAQPGQNYQQRIRFLIKCSKNIVFSFAFTSVSDSDVRKNFVSFQKEILPYLVKAAIQV